MRRVTSSSFAILLATATVIHSATAEESVFILGTGFAGSMDVIEQVVFEDFRDRTGPGSSVIYLDAASGETLAGFVVDDDRVYENVNLRMRHYGGYAMPAVEHIQTLGDNGLEADVFRAITRFANDRVGQDEPGQVLVVGDVMTMPGDDRFAMRQGDQIMVPDDGLIAGSIAASPYGTQGREDVLGGLSFHVCAANMGDLSGAESVLVERTFGLWIERQGGQLITFTPDLRACVDRFARRIDEPKTFSPLNPSSELAMRLPEVPPALADMEQTPEQFSLFSTVNHPTRVDVLVKTGVSYLIENYPTVYDLAWCYLPLVSRDNVESHLPVGRKRYGEEISWTEHAPGELAAVQITAAEFEQARLACRFPDN